MSKRQIRGKVVSDASDKTIVVELTRRETHPLYGKRFTTSSKFHAHDENNEAKIGDVVLIEECAPLSRTKTWKMIEIIEKGREKLTLKKAEIEEEVDEAERRASEHEKAEDDESLEDKEVK